MVLRAPRAFLLGLVVLTGCNAGRDKLIADLQSARPEERALAVHKLAEMSNSDDLVLFTQAAKDPVAIVRGEAVVALGKSQDPRVVDLLGEALGDQNEDVQAKAAMALASIRNEKAKAYLTLQYERRGRPTRQVIVQALKSSNIPGAMAGVVAAEAQSIWDRNLKALTEGTLPERVGAAEELGKSGRVEAVERLLNVLKDPQVVLVAAAARGLGNAGDKRATPALTALLKENSGELREAACEALSQLKDPAALDDLQAVAAEHSPSSPFAVAAIISLGKSDAADKVLCGLALGSSPDAAAAGREMRKRGGCPLDPFLDKLKSQSTAADALSAIAALGPTAKDAAPKVEPFLAQDNVALKRLAIEAVAELSDKAAAPALLKAYEAETKALDALRSDWVQVKFEAKYSKDFDPDLHVDPKDPNAQLHVKQIDLLKKVHQLALAKAQDHGKTVREPTPPREVVDDATAAQLETLALLVRAMGRLGVEGVKDIAAKYVDEADPQLRAAAFTALAAQGPEGLKLAEPGLADGDREVQAATARAFAEAGPDGEGALLEQLKEQSGDRSRLLEPFRNHPPSKAAVTVLVQLVKDGGVEGGLAAQLLGDVGAADAVAPLLKALEDPTLVPRREVLLAVGRLKDPKAADVIARDLYNDRYEVRSAAAEALETCGAPVALDALDALKGDYYRKVREATSKALAKLSPEAKK